MSKKPTVLDPPAVEAIRKLYAQGNVTYKELGQIFDLHSATVCKMINGQTFRKVKMFDKPKKRLTPEERALIITLTQQGYFNDEIAEQIGCSEFTIRYHRRQARKGQWLANAH